MSRGSQPPRSSVVVVRVVGRVRAVVRVRVRVAGRFAWRSVGDRHGRGQDQAAGLDALGADQAIGELTDRPGRAAEQDHLHAAAGVDVNVGGRDDVVQMEVLELIEESIVGGLILPEVANAWRAVRADISKLLGLDQPTRHVTARVNVDADPPALRLKQAVGGLDDDQLEEVARFAASLARKPAVKGEDWFPAKPKGELPQ